MRKYETIVKDILKEISRHRFDIKCITIASGTAGILIKRGDHFTLKYFLIDENKLITSEGLLRYSSIDEFFETNKSPIAYISAGVAYYRFNPYMMGTSYEIVKEQWSPTDYCINAFENGLAYVTQEKAEHALSRWKRIIIHGQR